MTLGYLTNGAFTVPVMGALVILAGVVCVLCAPSSVAATGKADPREVVVDEFSGQALVFFLIGKVPVEQVCIMAGLGFGLFRVFDIAKPWPIRRLEKLSGGWGILADDLFAGLYAALVALLCIRFVIV
jgi:phosphatidylglycerophosphatase A